MKGDYIELHCECGGTKRVKGTKFEYYCPKCGEPFIDVFPKIGNTERDKEREAKMKARMEEQKRTIDYIMTGRR